jgi:hypothetical protein
MKEGGIVAAQPQQGQDGSDVLVVASETNSSVRWQLQHVEAVETIDDEKEVFEEKYCERWWCIWHGQIQ